MPTQLSSQLLRVFSVLMLSFDNLVVSLESTLASVDQLRLSFNGRLRKIVFWLFDVFRFVRGGVGRAPRFAWSRTEMPLRRLLLICVVAWSASVFVMPSNWISWLARLERQAIPLPEHLLMHHPLFTSLLVDVLIPVFRLLSLPVGVAALGAIVATLLIKRWGIQDGCS